MSFNAKDILSAQQWLEKCYMDSIGSNDSRLKCWFQTLSHWYKDAERSGVPNDAVTRGNIKQVLKIWIDDRKVKVLEIPEMVNISTKCVYDFTPKIRHEKGLFQMGAMFGHNGTKATTNERFRELFDTAIIYKKQIPGNNMDPPFHSLVESAVSTVASSRWKPPEASENATFCCQSLGVSFLRWARYNLNQLPWKGGKHLSSYITSQWKQWPSLASIYFISHHTLQI